MLGANPEQIYEKKTKSSWREKIGFSRDPSFDSQRLALESKTES